MKIKVWNKELQEQLTKISKVVPKKSSLAELERVVFISGDGLGCRLMAGTPENFINVLLNTDICEMREGEAWSIDLKEILKIFKNFNDDVVIETTDDEQMLFASGKRKVKTKCYDATNYFLSNFDKVSKEKLFRITGNYLIDTMDKLKTFLKKDPANELLGLFEFDLKYHKVVALDGHRIGIRKLDIENFSIESERDVLINLDTLAHLKDYLKKSDEVIECRLVDSGYIGFFGSNFRYYQKIYDKEYFNIDKMFTDYQETSIIINKNALKGSVEIVKDMFGKETTRPLVMDITDGLCVVSGAIQGNEYTEELDIIKKGKDLKIGFNSQYIVDMLNLIENECVQMNFNNAKSPVIIENEEFVFLLLPVNINA